jgi:hypothetical protein
MAVDLSDAEGGQSVFEGILRPIILRDYLKGNPGARLKRNVLEGERAQEVLGWGLGKQTAF